MDQTPVSHSMTFPMKYGFPLIWGGIWSYGTAQMFRTPPGITWSDGGPPPPWAKWVFAGGLVVGAAVIGLVGARLKRITIDQHYLRISNYLKEIAVPLSTVSAVGLSTSFTINDQALAVIELRLPTPFGQEVTFLPKNAAMYQLLCSAVTAAGGTLAPPADSSPGQSAA